MELPVALPVAKGLSIHAQTLPSGVYVPPGESPFSAPCLVQFYSGDDGSYLETALYAKRPDGSTGVFALQVYNHNLGSN